MKVYTTASPANHPFLLTLGATQCFDYRDPDVVKKIREASNGSIEFALDAACEAGSTDMVVDAVGEKAEVVTTLPISEETKKRRAGVKVDFTLVYTLLGYALTFANAISLPAMPNDNAQSLNYVENEMPKVSSKIISQKLRRMPGGLEKIEEGLRVMEKGEYKAEKIIYEL